MPARRLPLLIALLALLIAPLAAPARALADPAAEQITSFDAALVDTMKEGPSLGVKGRYHKLEPVIARTFDLPTMARFASGPAWSSFTPAQQQAVVEAFGRLTTASYAHNFASYGGEKFVVDANVVTRGPDKVVATQLVRPGNAPVALDYRMRQSAGGDWKVIDVLYGAISQLTTRRSDFAAPIASGGAPGLVAHLNTVVDGLLK